MMKSKIKSQNLLKLLDILKNKVKVLTPQKDEFGDTYFLPVKDASKVELKHFKPLMPAVREVLFGQTGEMIKYKKQGGKTNLESIDKSVETIIFGLPNCDLDGILYNDVFFAQREFADFYYCQARRKLTLITIACLTPPNASCFCASMGHGPFAQEGYDLQLTDMGDGYFFVEEGSAKGEKLTRDHASLFEKVSAEDEKKRAALEESARKLPLKDFVHKDKVLQTMGREALNEAVITDVSNRCISCGACNYTCPTCTCFNVTDLEKEGQGTRARILDSCVLSGYFRMAGGHNPKAKKDERTRNRYFCKLIWDQEKFGDSGCVGCGRCLDSCPVDIDIKEVMRSIA